MANNWNNEMRITKRHSMVNSSIIKEWIIVMESFVVGLDNWIDIEFQLFCLLSWNEHGFWTLIYRENSGFHQKWKFGWIKNTTNMFDE